MQKKSIYILTIGLFGLALIIFSQPTITAAVTGVRANTSLLAYAGSFFILLSAALFMISHAGLEKITLTDDIKEHPALKRLAARAVRNQDVQRDIKHLTNRLSKGHLQAGLNRPGHVEGTDIRYLRGKKGGRLFFREIGHGHEHCYQIVGKSAKGRNEDQVINALKKNYSKN